MRLPSSALRTPAICNERSAGARPGGFEPPTNGLEVASDTKRRASPCPRKSRTRWSEHVSWSTPVRLVPPVERVVARTATRLLPAGRATMCRWRTLGDGDYAMTSTELYAARNGRPNPNVDAKGATPPSKAAPGKLATARIRVAGRRNAATATAAKVGRKVTYFRSRFPSPSASRRAAIAASSRSSSAQSSPAPSNRSSP